MNQPFHAAEGGLGSPDEVAITGHHQLTLLSVVIRNVGGFPVASGRNKPVKCLDVQCVQTSIRSRLMYFISEE